MVTGKVFTTEGLKGIKYAVVGVISKADKKSAVITGYFLGIRGIVGINTQMVNKNDLFIWLIKGETVHVLNLSHYEVDSLEINLNGSSTKYSAYKEEENISRLKAIQEAMATYNMLHPNGLIDTDRFTNVPEATKKIVENDIKPTYKTVNKTAYSSTSQAYPAAYNSYHPGRTTTTYKKKEVGTFIIKRTTKYPISSALERMKLKIDAIKEGTYEAPKLAGIPADKELKEGEKKEDKPETKTTEQAHMEEVYGYSNHGGPWVGP